MTENTRHNQSETAARPSRQGRSNVVDVLGAALTTGVAGVDRSVDLDGKLSAASMGIAVHFDPRDHPSRQRDGVPAGWISCKQTEVVRARKVIHALGGRCGEKGGERVTAVRSNA